MNDPARRLRALHHADTPLILPNAWDVASARAVERAGASAIARSSSAVAESLGFEDGEKAPPDEMFSAIARIASGVALPVTADIEGGYGLEAAELVERLIATGAAGMNVEDTDRHSAAMLVPVDRQARRISAIRDAAAAAGVPLVINARIDVYRRDRRSPEAVTDEAIERAGAYLAGGAECVYPIFLCDATLIGRIVDALQAPVNILLRPGAPPISELHRLGVRRISVGGGLAKRAMDTIARDARTVIRGDASPFTG